MRGVAIDLTPRKTSSGESRLLVDELELAPGERGEMGFDGEG